MFLSIRMVLLLAPCLAEVLLYYNKVNDTLPHRWYLKMDIETSRILDLTRTGI
jgi:hypothetical protein